MRIPNLRRWGDLDNLSGLLLVAQRMEEALFDYTLDSYKAPALNTFTRALELENTLEEIRGEDIRDSAAIPVIEELAASIKSDTVAKSVLGNHWEYYSDLREWQKKNPHQLEVFTTHLIEVLRDEYENELIRQLRALIPAAREKERISRLTLDLIVQWQVKGYSKDYVFWRTRQFFYSSHGDRIDSFEAFERFVDLFRTEGQRWTVLFRTSESLRHLARVLAQDPLRILIESPKPRTRDVDETRFLSQQHEGVYVQLMVEALDARTARKAANGMLESIMNLARFHVHRTAFSWGGEALVYDEQGNPFVLKAPVGPILKHPEPQLTNLEMHVLRTVRAFYPETLPEESSLRLARALNLHSAALRSETVEAQLFALWSAFESLLPLAGMNSLISKVLEVAVPVLSRHYPRKLLSDLHTSLSRHLSANYTNVLAHIEGNWSEVQKCAALVSISTNANLREEIARLCDKIPLLKHRLYDISQKLTSADAISQTIKQHSQRIGWHVNRMYRSRNLLVHSGRLLPYHETLVENLHTYLDSTINLLEESFTSPKPPTSVDAAFLAVILDHQAHLKFLERSGRSVCTEANFLSAVFGPT